VQPKPTAARTPVVERLDRLAIADRATQVLVAPRWR